MITSKNHHQPKWMPWVLWLLWNPVDALGCRNEHTGVTDHAKITTALLVAASLVLHALKLPLQWWELLVLGTLCFGSLALYTVLLKSGIFKGQFSATAEEKHDVTETIAETVTVREARDPALGVDPA